jgi:hypothetical protein
LSGVAARRGPAEYEVEAEVGACDEGGEEEEDERRGVVERLEGGDLAEDFERLELGEGAGARGSAAARHVCAVSGDGGFGCWFCVALPGDHGRSGCGGGVCESDAAQRGFETAGFRCFKSLSSRLFCNVFFGMKLSKPAV